jgi:RNA polymerase sigma factor (sigma-70 family)
VPASLSERKELLTSHQKLAHKFARKNQYRFQRVYEYEDLFAIAMTAIWEASGTYEAELGASFTTYAFTACLNIFRNLHKHWRRPNRAGTLQTVSLDQQWDSDAPAWQPASTTPSAEAEIERQELCRLLDQQVRRLDARSRRVIVARFEGDETLEIIGQREGVTREYIRQIEKKALGQIRQALKMGLPELSRAPETSSRGEVEPRTAATSRNVARRRSLAGS